MAESTAASVSSPHPPAALHPLDAMRTIWEEPGAVVRRLIDHGDGGLWPWLLLAEMLAGPVAWFAAGMMTGREFLPVAGVGFVSFLGFMVLTVASLIGGLLVVGLAANRSARRRDIALAVAWGLLPILPAAPLALVFSRAGDLLTMNVFGIVVVTTLSLVLLWATALFLTLFTALEALRGAGRLMVTPVLLVWIGIHGVAVAFTWFGFMSGGARGGVD